MRNFLLRLLINAVALAAIAEFMGGIHMEREFSTVLIVAFIFGLVNAIAKPVIFILSCPLILFTLGLFLLAINGIMLLLTDALAGDRFTVDSFWWAVGGGMVMGLISAFLEGALGLKDDDDKDEGIIVIRS